MRAYRLLAEHAEPGLFNICSGVSRSARELVAGLGAAAGVDIVHEVDPARVRANEVMDVRGSSSRLHAATGWQPEIPFEQTLQDFADRVQKLTGEICLVHGGGRSPTVRRLGVLSGSGAGSVRS